MYFTLYISGTNNAVSKSKLIRYHCSEKRGSVITSKNYQSFMCVKHCYKVWNKKKFASNLVLANVLRWSSIHVTVNKFSAFSQILASGEWQLICKSCTIWQRIVKLSRTWILPSFNFMFWNIYLALKSLNNTVKMNSCQPQLQSTCNMFQLCQKRRNLTTKLMACNQLLVKLFNIWLPHAGTVVNKSRYYLWPLH